MSEINVEALPITWSPQAGKEGNLDIPTLGPAAGNITTFLSKAVNAMFIAHKTQDLKLLHQYVKPNAQAGIIGHNPSLDAVPKSVEIEYGGTLYGDYETDDLLMRFRVSVSIDSGDFSLSVTKIFIDIALDKDDSSVLVTNCPNCGAPVESGSHVCKYCRVDLRATNPKTFKVVKVQFY